jgi:hypothetical protein
MSGFGEERCLKTLEITRADLRQIEVDSCSVKGKMHSMSATRLAERRWGGLENSTVLIEGRSQ